MAAIRRFLLILILLPFYLSLYGQTDTSPLSRLVKLPPYAGPVGPLLKEISLQADVRFSYNSSRVTLSQPIQLRAGTYSVRQILMKVQSVSAITYAVIGEHIVLRMVPPPPHLVAAESTNSTNQRESVSQSPQSIAPVIVPVSDSLLPRSMITCPEARDFTAVRSLSTPSLIGEAIPLPTHELNNANKLSEKSGTAKRKRIQEPVTILMGITTDDTGLTGPSLQAGLRRLFGTITYRSNLQINTLLVGGGTGFRITDQTQILLQGSIGRVSRSFQFSSDTATSRIKATGTFRQASVIFQRQITSSFRFQAGIYAGFLHSAYTDTLGARYGASTPYPILTPHVSFRNEVSSSRLQSDQVWLGFQLSLYYSFPIRKNKRTR